MKPWSRLAAALLLILPACSGRTAPDPSQPWDLLITGGTVIDGTGARRFTADVAVRGGRIVRVSRRRLAPTAGTQVVDATGLGVAPGLLAPHAHLAPLRDRPGAESHVRQGVTLAVGGPDGGGPWPVGRYLDSAQALGIGLNIALQVGHNTVRRIVMGNGDRAPTPDELRRMRGMVAQAMGEGAVGLSTGLAYLPGVYSRTDEIVELSRVAADSGGIYTSHMRDEARGLMASVDETITIGRDAHIPVVITHAKAVGRPAWGRSVQMLAAVDSARRHGVDAMLDVYPYTASHTGIGILVPSWALEGGDAAFQRRRRDRRLRDSLVAGIIDLIENERGGGDLRFVLFSRVPFDRSLEGRTMADWARQKGLEPSPRVGADLVIEALQRGGANAIYHVMNEDDVQRIMRHPQTMIASDGRLSRPGEGHPHPRAYGTFPRVLGRYVRELQVLTLEDAVKKMTSMPADRLGMADRGRIAEGAAADITIFDPATVADQATFEAPHQYPVGIKWVIVNGTMALDTTGVTGNRGGRALRRPVRPS